MTAKILKFISLFLTASIIISSLTSCNSFISSDEDEYTDELYNPLMHVYDIPTVTPAIKTENHFYYDSENNVYSITSPDGLLTFYLYEYTKKKNISYRVTMKNQVSEKTSEWIRSSSLGVTLDKTKYFANDCITDVKMSAVERNIPLNGNKRYVEDRAVQAVFTLENGSYKYYLDVRAYNNGVAFRYRLPSDGKSRKLGSELTTFSLPLKLREAWYSVDNMAYEGVVEPHSTTKSPSDIISLPMTAVTKETNYISITEGNTTDSYSGIHLTAGGNCTYKAAFYKEFSKNNKSNKYYAYDKSYNAVPAIEGDITTSWRIISLAENLNQLVNNDIVYCVNDEPDSEPFADTDWIQPGKSTWSWCLKHKAPTYDEMMEYTKAAAELGFEYNIIDDGWPRWDDYESKLEQLGTLAQDNSVKQILWCALTRGKKDINKTTDETSFDEFLKLMERTHMSGAKVDFWQSEVNPYTAKLQKYMLKKAAEQKYVIDFHGCPKNVGWNVTYPNELTREAIRGLEFLGTADNTKYGKYTNMLNSELYTRFLCGHADWTPATYNAMQIGSIICIDSPFMTIASAPDSILNSPAVEFIKSIPTVWDKTIVLPQSQIGKCSVYAKQHEGTWFIGGLVSKDKETIEIFLSDILKDSDGAYYAEIWSDKNGKKLLHDTKIVTSEDLLSLGTFDNGEGFAVRLSKLEMSQYGGKINEPVTLKAMSDDAVIYYTTDGSDPLYSDTAKLYSQPVTLTESCRLKAAIRSGDGTGTRLSYQFNKM